MPSNQPCTETTWFPLAAAAHCSPLQPMHALVTYSRRYREAQSSMTDTMFTLKASFYILHTHTPHWSLILLCIIKYIFYPPIFTLHYVKATETWMSFYPGLSISMQTTRLSRSPPAGLESGDQSGIKLDSPEMFRARVQILGVLWVDGDDGEQSCHSSLCCQLSFSSCRWPVHCRAVLNRVFKCGVLIVVWDSALGICIWLWYHN